MYQRSVVTAVSPLLIHLLHYMVVPRETYYFRFQHPHQQPICQAARAGPVRNLGRYSSVSIYRCLNSQHRQRQPRDEREVQIIAILLRFMYPYDYLHCIVHCFPFLVGLGMGLKNGSAWEKFASHSRSVEHSLDGRAGERQFRQDP